jgi:hypothetical protein
LISGSTSRNQSAYPDSSWSSGPGLLGFAGSSPQNSVTTTTQRYVSGGSGEQVNTTYFRSTFTLDTTNEITSLVFQLLRDDGAVIYINGVETTRHNMPTGDIAYSTFSAGITGSENQTSYHVIEITDTSSLVAGENTIALEVHQCNSGSSDLYMDLELTVICSSVCTESITIEEPLTVKARSFDGNEWSALSEASFEIAIPQQEYQNLKVTELMYAPTNPTDPESTFDNDDFAWLELRNTGLTSIDLNGISFVDGITHTFTPYNLQAGARLILAKNADALTQRHSTNNMDVMEWSSGNLARGGETIAIATPTSSNILCFTYSSTWYPETYNTDRSIVVVNTAAEEALWSTSVNWRPSLAMKGSPGTPDSPIFKAMTLAPDNLMTVSTEGLEGTIELWYSEDLKNWIPCDTQVWSRDNDNITISTKSPLLPDNGKGFFQLRISD